MPAITGGLVVTGGFFGLLVKWISSDLLGLKVIPSASPQLRASWASLYRLL